MLCPPVRLPVGLGSCRSPRSVLAQVYTGTGTAIPQRLQGSGSRRTRNSSAVSVLTSSHYAGLPPDHGIYYRCCS